MVKKKIVLKNITGLHMGPAGKLCDEAIKYSNTTIKFIYNDNYEANIKSMLSVLGAGIQPGQEIEIVCDGLEEQEALESLVSLIERNFDFY